MNEEINLLLEKLGLTEYEAKILSALFKLRESEAPNISRMAQVPKTRVYDVLDRLIKRGMVIEIFGRPKKYRVIDPTDAFNGLINAKKIEITELEKKMNEIKNLAYEKEEKTLETSEKVMKVKDKQDFLKILTEEIKNAKQEVIGLTELGDYNILKEVIKKKLKKNVKIRLVSPIKEENKDIAREVKKLGVELKDLNHNLTALVIDGEKAILGLSDFNKSKQEYHFVMWGKNNQMIEVLNNYFNHCWSKGK